MMKCWTGYPGRRSICQDLETGEWSLCTPNTNPEAVQADLAVAEAYVASRKAQVSARAAEGGVA